MAMGLTSLFRPLPDGAIRQEVVIEQNFARARLVFRGVSMNIFEQGVFFAVLALALRGGESREAGRSDMLPTLPRADLPDVKSHTDNMAAAGDCVEVRTTLAELCGMAGLARKPGGETIAAIKTAFARLSGVTVFAEMAGRWGITHLIGGGLGRGGEVVVRLNPRATKALLDDGSGSYAQVEMPTYRALHRPVARALYAWMAAWYCGRSGERQIGLDKLEVHLFGAIAKNRSTRSGRRKQIVEALKAIGIASAGEYQGEAREGVAHITRAWAAGAELRPARDTITPSARQVCL
jgi:hypothetical protein